MSLPKKIKKDIDIKVTDPYDGPQNWSEQFLEQNKQFLPREVAIDDLDKGFVDFVNNDLEITIEGKKIPIHFLTLQRWNEFAKTWRTSDKYKNIKIPFMSIVRRPNPEQGTNPADFKIPVRKEFPYMQIPIWDGNRKGADIYGIPNPVGVDMYYTVRFFTFRMRELNKLTKKILQTFASAQAYVNIKGHYFPIMLESIGDESQVDDINGKRYYVQSYEMKLMGYLVDTEEFEVKPAISRVFLTTELDSKKPKNITKFIKDDTSDNQSLKCVIQFLPGAGTSIKFNVDNKTDFTTIDTNNITTYTIYKNGSVVNVPFSVEPSDVIEITVVKVDSNKTAEIIINGLITV
tara:strand:+ start:2098 stop:3138 length:1041 start_codon:yes stop_codon:yes gene_type:complete